MNALNASPRTKQKTARANLLRSSGAASAPATPHAPHASICHGVHEPWPRKKLETNAATAPTAKPLRAPRAIPATTVITVTGCTPGMAANNTRPAAAAAASVAISTSSLDESGPRSSQAMPAASSAKATRRSDSPSWEESSALHIAAPNVTTPADSSAALDKGRLPAQHDRAIRDGRRKLLVMRDEERRSPVCAAPKQRGEPDLTPGIDPSCRLVEDQHVWLDDEDRG